MSRLITLLIFLMAESAFGQGFAVGLFYDPTVAPLTNQCGSGDILPDGTTVEIFWDDNSDGPDPTDALLPLNHSSQPNFNTFPLNTGAFGFPGGFILDPLFSCAVGVPVPPRFWIRICVPDSNRYYRSEVWTVQAGLNQDIVFTLITNLADSATVNNAIWCIERNCNCDIADAPPGISATSYECDLTVSWIDVTYEHGYFIYRNTVLFDSVGANVTNWIDVTALGGVSYQYQVTSYNECGERPAMGSSTGIRTTAPSVPSGLAASDDRCDAIQVSWNDVSQEEGYIVRRNGSSVAFLDANQTEFTDPVGPGCFSYRVQAYNGCGASLQSASATGCRYTSPSVISFQQSSENCDSTYLQFQVSSNSDSVAVYRDGLLLARVSRSVSSYSDYIGIAGDYHYNVAAENLCGNSSSSDTLVGTINEFPSAPSGLQTVEDSCSSITVSWLPASGDFGHYEVYRDSGLIATLPNTELIYVDEGLMGGAEYSYWVIAVNDTCGSSEPSDVVTASITVASDPDSTHTVIAMQGASAVLHWSPVDSTVQGCPITVTHYLIFYSPTEEGPYYYHGLTSDTTYVHTGVIAYAPAMFYTVTPMTGAVPSLLRDVETGEMTREEVMEKIEN